MVETSVWATTSFVGFHRWPAATGDRVYLGSMHRHLFRVVAELEVDGRDRQVEFHDLLGYLRAYIDSLWPSLGGHIGRDLGTRSCEEAARELAGGLREVYPNTVTVTISEDGECGARVRHT